MSCRLLKGISFSSSVDVGLKGGECSINVQEDVAVEHSCPVVLEWIAPDESQCTWLSHWAPRYQLFDDPSGNRDNGILIVRRPDGACEISVDHFASQPLFWGHGKSIWCSNVFDNVVSKIGRSEVDRVAFWELALFETPFGERTLLRGVKLLQAGTTLVIDPAGNALTRRYGYLQFRDAEVSDTREFADRAVSLLSNAIQAQGTSSKMLFPMGGGLDSRWSLGVLTSVVGASQIQGMTYGYSRWINEFRYAKNSFAALGLDEPAFHRLGKDSYLPHLRFLSRRTGGLIGIGNTHCLDYLKKETDKSNLNQSIMISNMFSDAICGFAARRPGSEPRTGIADTSYYQNLGLRSKQFGIPADVSDAIISDLKGLEDEWKASTIKTLSEFIYIRERNTKFQLMMTDMWRGFLPVRTPFTDWDVAGFFLGLPEDLRFEKRCVDLVLAHRFPNLARIGVISSLDHLRGNRNWWKDQEQRFARRINRLLAFRLHSRLSVVDRYATENRTRLLLSHFQPKYVESLEFLVELEVLPAESMQEFRDIQRVPETTMYQLMTNASVLSEYA